MYKRHDPDGVALSDAVLLLTQQVAAWPTTEARRLSGPLRRAVRVRGRWGRYSRGVLRVTVDSDILPRQMQQIREAVGGLSVEIAPTTVTLREQGVTRLPDEEAVQETLVWNESPWGESVWGPSPPVYETLTLGESRLGMAVLGGDDAPSRFEAILDIIGNGSFPKSGERDDLIRGELHQLRDAMILEAHARDGRDVLVSNDVTAFGGAGRSKLEALCHTKIRTLDEFCREVETLAARQLDTKA
jgi:hypothetical protein